MQCYQSCFKLLGAQLLSMQPVYCHINVSAFISQCLWFWHSSITFANEVSSFSIPWRFGLCEHLLFSKVKCLLCSRVQREVMSAVKIGVGRLEMSSMPATAPMTVWPEETVAPTTRHCVKVWNTLCLSCSNAAILNTVQWFTFTGWSTN